MIVRIIVKKNEFYNSVFLMRISAEANRLPGIDQSAVLMATDLNKEVLELTGLSSQAMQDAGPNDLVIALRAEMPEAVEKAMGEIEAMLQTTPTEVGEEFSPRTLNSALGMMPEANVVVISVPGQFAKRETLKSLEKGRHVFLFSSNVNIEDELELKLLAKKKGVITNGAGLRYSYHKRRRSGFR